MGINEKEFRKLQKSDIYQVFIRKLTIVENPFRGRLRVEYNLTDLQFKQMFKLTTQTTISSKL